MLRKTTAALAVLVGLGLAPAATASANAVSAGTTTANCAVDWGSQDQQSADTSPGPLVDLRAGQQECFDRLVFDIPGGGAGEGHLVGYRDVIHADGSGEVIPLRGGAKLLVVAHSPAHDDDGAPTYTFADRSELVDVTGYRTFRQVAWGNSFEGRSTVGLGVRARLPFRVFTGPGGLVVEGAHSW
ncbi:AMIN-like domain-containing (lipo)protein [Actinosynnema sp.]|uniref:AMIN-like domain-containing (lipo)protein n=1 Tax=Actinosynnema sp. TaxID=1872144 RepID=UPI003F8348F6